MTEMSFSLKGRGMPYYAAVGQAASTWSNLEHQIDLAIAALIGDQIDVALALLAQVGSIHSKLESLLAIIQQDHRGPASAKSVKKLSRFMNEIRPLSIRRNRIIHDQLVLDGDEVKFLRLTTKGNGGKLTYELAPFEVKEFQSFIASVADKVEEFKNLRREIAKEVPTLNFRAER